MTIYINAHLANDELVETIQSKVREGETIPEVIKEMLYEMWAIEPVRDESFEYQIKWNKPVLMTDKSINAYFMLKNPHWVRSTFDLCFDIFELEGI